MAQDGIGICLVAAGRAGLIHGRAFAARAVPGARLVAVVEPDAEARAKAQAELGPVAAFAEVAPALAHPEVDAVVIAAPTALHRAIAVAAAGAGKHILCEKPLAMTVAECDAVIAAATAAGVVLQVGFMRRYDADYREARERIQAGEIGAVVQVASHTYGPSTPQPWMYDLASSNGPLAEVNSHDLDMVRWLNGGEYVEVHAIAGNYRSPQALPAHPDFYDTVILTATLDNGRQGLVRGAQGVGYAYDARCEILGTEGIIQVGRMNADGVSVTNRSGMRRKAVASWRTLFTEAYLAEDRDFVACIREGRPPLAGGADGRAAVAAVNAGNRSIRERRPVRIQEVCP